MFRERRREWWWCLIPGKARWKCRKNDRKQHLKKQNVEKSGKYQLACGSIPLNVGQMITWKPRRQKHKISRNYPYRVNIYYMCTFDGASVKKTGTAHRIMAEKERKKGKSTSANRRFLSSQLQAEWCNRWICFLWSSGEIFSNMYGKNALNRSNKMRSHRTTDVFCTGKVNVPNQPDIATITCIEISSQTADTTKIVCTLTSISISRNQKKFIMDENHTTKTEEKS